MVQKYKNEIAPIFYYGKSPKTNEKDLEMPNLRPPNWGQPYWMTLYLSTTHHSDMLGGWWQRLCLFAIYLASGRWKQWLRYKSILTDGHSDNGRKVYHYVIIYFDECYSFAVYLSFGLCKTHMCKCKLILHRFVWHDSRPTFSNFIYYEYALTCPWWKLFLSFSCLHLW